MIRGEKNLADLLLGWMGAFTSIITAAQSFIPWALGIALTSLAIYNQWQQIQINKKKLKDGDRN